MKISGLAVIKNNKLLLLYKKKRNHYEFPGGKVDLNESFEEAAIREGLEECNIKVKIITGFGPYFFIKMIRK